MDFIERRFVLRLPSIFAAIVVQLTKCNLELVLLIQLLVRVKRYCLLSKEDEAWLACFLFGAMCGGRGL